MHDLTVSGNLLEALLWAGIAWTLAAWAMRESGPKRRLWGKLAAAFLVFAISDVIESQTGAWWRPLWLLGLKAGCLVMFLSGAREYRKIHSPTSPPVASPPQPPALPDESSDARPARPPD